MLVCIPRASDRCRLKRRLAVLDSEIEANTEPPALDARTTVYRLRRGDYRVSAQADRAVENGKG
jgi:hypothetical protein